MRLLLDTQVFLWSQSETDRLGPHLALLADPQHELVVSAASCWEIAVKWALGKLPLPEPPAIWVPQRMAAMAATPVSVSHAQALAVAELPPVHRDPFDRLLVTQCRDLDATLVSADPVFSRYDVELIAVGER